MKDLPGKVAKQIFAKSLPLKKGSAVVIETWDCNEELARAIELEARRLNHSVITLFNDSYTFVEFGKKLPSGKKLSLGKHEISMLKNTDGYIFIPGPEMATSTSSLDPDKLRAVTSYNMQWYGVAAESKLKGIRLQAGYYNSDRAASVLGKKRSEVVDHLLASCLVNPSVIAGKARTLSRHLRTGRNISIQSDSSVLVLRTGKEEEIDDGRTDDVDVKKKINMSSLPGGLYVRELGAGAKGRVKFDSLFIRGKKLQQARVEFSGGRVVSYSSPKMDKAMNEMLDGYIANGKNGIPSYIGVGLNPVLKRGYGRDTQVSGNLALWIGPAAYGIVSSPSLSAGEKKLITKGKLAF